MFFEKLRLLGNSRYHPLNVLEVSRKKLFSNFKKLNLINSKIRVCPVLKSNAYGHGLVETGKILDRVNPPFICVDSIFEAYKLYKHGLKSKILIMGYVNPENLKFKKLPFSYAVYSLNQLKAVLNHQPQSGIHIFVDTGMHREGILVNDLDSFVKGIPKEYIKNIEGVMSHFAASESPNHPKTIDQVKEFKKALGILKKNKIFPVWRHIANTSGLLNNQKLHLDEISNMARCGFGLYDSVLKFKTHIVQLKDLIKGDRVGYNFSYAAKKNLKLAVLPVGYNDGVDRALSNRGTVVIKGVDCPIIGRVSMNITTVDVSGIKNAKVGDEVEIHFNIPVKDRIPYEFYVHLNPEIRRIVVD